MGCIGLTSVTIPNSVASIGIRAFQSCSSLPSVIIPNSVTYIGDAAFAYCNSLPSVIIPTSVDSIRTNVFRDCIGLTSVTIPNSVITIGVSAFQGCSGLTSVIIPNSVASIRDSAFQGCSGLTSVIIPDSVTSIGHYAFYSDSSLTAVIIGNSVASIGDRVFDECHRLTSVTIPNSVDSIGNYAFRNCFSLTSVTIGNSVASIGNYAFAYCDSLANIYVKAETPPQIGSTTFQGVSVSIPVHVPCGKASDYQSAQYWSTFTNIIDAAPAISVQSSDMTMGTVAVTQQNTCTDDAIIEATPNAGYRFVKWNDNNNTNPRTVTVTQDTAFTATFEANTGITEISHTSIQMYPNPVTNGQLTLSNGQGKVEIYTVQGVQVGSYSLTDKETSIDISHLASGVYFVKTGNTTRKLVVNK
jgi:hypothetical protein